MKKLAIILVSICWSLCAFATGPGKIEIVDTLYRPDGVLLTGTLRITNKTFTSVDGFVVQASETVVAVTNGALDIFLVPTAGGNPTGQSYTVKYYVSNQLVAEVWTVPGAGPTNLLGVRALSAPLPVQMLAMSQINPPVPCLNGQVPAWQTATSSWLCVNNAGGGGGSGTVTQVTSGNFSPLFSVAVATNTITPAFSFSAINQNQNLLYAGPSSGAAAAPSFRATVKLDLPGSTVYNDQANIYTAGMKQTVQSSASTAGFNLAGVSADPSGLAAGDHWYRTDLDHLRYRGQSAVKQLFNSDDTLPYGQLSGTPQLANTLANVTHKWLNSYSAITGNFTQTQPDYSDLTGTPTLAATLANSANKWLNSYDASTGLFTQTQPGFGNLSGSVAASQMPALTGDVTTSAGAVATTLGNIPDAVTQAGKIIATNIAAPATPASGKTSIYVDSTSKKLCSKDDAGSVNCTGGGGGTTTTGTGFWHNTSGTLDAASRAVDVSTADIAGVLKAAAFPALTGDVTTASGALASTLANIPDAVTQAGKIIATNTAAPASPAAGKDSLFTDSTDLRFHDKNASGVIGTTVVADAGASNNFLTAISAAGAISKAQPGFSNLSGSVAAAQMPALTGDVTTSAGAVATTLGNIPDAVTQAGKVVATNIAAPASPAAGKDSLFTDSTDLRFHDKNASGVIGTTVVADAGASNNFLTAISAAGAISKAQPSFSNLSGSVAASQMPALTGAITTSAGAVATSPGKDDLLDSQNFCAAAGASGTTYSCNLSPAISAYVTGTHYRFKADVANTAAATINLNSLGAKTIKKHTGGITTDVVANDLQAGAWVDLVYDGTNMQCQSGCDGNASAGGSSPLTTKGDIYTRTTVDARLPVGSDGYSLVADSGATTGLRWSGFVEPRRLESVVATVNGGGGNTTFGVGTQFGTNGTANYVAGTTTESVMESFATATTLNSDANWYYGGGGTMTTNSDIIWKGRFGFDDGAAGVTNTRAIVGVHVGASGFNTNVFPTTADIGSSGNEEGFFFRCSSSVPDTNWTATTYNGTTTHTQASSVACSTTKHTFKIIFLTGASVAFSIDGAAPFYTMSTAADLPSGIAAQFMGVRNLTAGTARNAYMGFMRMEGN